MDSADEAMTTMPVAKQSAAFTLTELLIIVVLISILSGVAIASFSQRRAQERLLAAARETHAWLENQRLIAMKEGQACAISINTTNATLDPSAERVPLTDGTSLNNSCKNQAPLVIPKTVTNGGDIVLSTSDPEATGVRFSFRGLSEIITTSSYDDDQQVLVLKLNHPDSKKQRCIKLMSPLGLIRTGWSEANADTCQFSNSF
jgi:Tfp pilus assembly protein FimT